MDTPAPTPSPATLIRHCAVCNQPYSESDMLVLEGQWVCGPCKPKAIQMLQQGMKLGASIIGRDGNKVVVPLDGALPPRCIKCNEPGVKTLKKRIVWHHPAWYLMLLFAFVGLSLLPYIVTYFIVRKTTKIEVSLCAKHLFRRRLALAAGWLIVLSFLVLGIVGAQFESGAFMMIGMFGFPIAAVTAMYFLRLIKPSRITKDHAWIKGAKKPFLDSLEPTNVKPS